MKDYNFYYQYANCNRIYMMTFFATTPEKFGKVLKYFNDKNCKIVKIEEI